MQATLVAIATTLAVTGGAVAQDGANPTPPPYRTHVPKRVVVPMDTDLVKPSVRVTINGHGPYRFLLDTGATPALVVNDDLVQELGLSTAPGGRIGDPANPSAIEYVQVPVDRVTIGGATFEQVTAISWDRTALYSGEDAPRGIVGFGLFRDVLLTLDYPAKRVVIERGELPPADGVHIVELGSDRGVQSVPITIGGKTFQAHLDSGSMGTIMLPLSLAAELPLTGEPVVVGQGRTVNSTFEVSRATLDGTVVFGPQTIVNPELSFNSLFKKVNVGSELLAGFSITIDQRNSRMRIEPGKNADQVRRANPRRSYGLMIDPRAKPMTIMRLQPGSIAERAGLQAGDIVREINGVAAETMLMGDMAKAFRGSPVKLRIERGGESLDITMSFDDAS